MNRTGIIFMLVLSFFFIPLVLNCNWYLYTVNQAKKNNAIDLSGNHIPYIAYRDYVNEYPRVSYYDISSESFIQMPVVDYTATDQVTISLDTLDYPHVLYRDITGTMFHASWNGSGWSTQPIAANSQYFSIDIDRNNVIHICYLDYEADDLNYLQYEEGTGWTLELVDTVLSINTDITIGEDGTPHITYTNLSDYSVKYAVKEGDNWITDVVESSVSSGHSSITVKNGIPYVSYTISGTYLDVKYAYKTGGVWNKSMVDAGNIAISHGTDIAVNETGEPRIVYVRTEVGPPLYYYLYIAQWSDYQDSWQIQKIDTSNIGNGAGSYGALDLTTDENNYLYISYNDNDQYCYFASTNPFNSGLSENSNEENRRNNSVKVTPVVFNDNALIWWDIDSGEKDIIDENSEIQVRLFGIDGKYRGKIKCDGLKGPEGEILWNCRNSRGTALKSGVYFLHFSVKEFSEIKKLTIIR